MVEPSLVSLQTSLQYRVPFNLHLLKNLFLTLVGSQRNSYDWKYIYIYFLGP